jgi:hypothetical protein
VDKSWQEPDEILSLFPLDEHKHGAIYAEAFHFPRDFTVIGAVSQKSLSEQGYPFSLMMREREKEIYFRGSAARTATEHCACCAINPMLNWPGLLTTVNE